MVVAMLKHKYLIFWLMGGTLVMTYILGNYYHYLNFTYPDFIVKWAMNLYNPSDQEEVADLETILNLIVSFVAISALTFIYLHVRKRLKKPQTDAETRVARVYGKQWLIHCSGAGSRRGGSGLEAHQLF